MAYLRRPLGPIALFFCWIGAILCNLGTLANLRRLIGYNQSKVKDRL